MPHYIMQSFYLYFNANNNGVDSNYVNDFTHLILIHKCMVMALENIMYYVPFVAEILPILRYGQQITAYLIRQYGWNETRKCVENVAMHIKCYWCQTGW